MMTYVVSREPLSFLWSKIFGFRTLFPCTLCSVPLLDLRQWFVWYCTTASN
jgi:hypothetical protein